MKEYIVQVTLDATTNFGIPIVVKAENNELALNKVQGMLYSQEGWIHLEDKEGGQHRIKGDLIKHLVIFPF